MAVDQSFERRVLPDERVVWSGRPSGGLVLTGEDVFLVPLSLLWFGFTIFWESNATRSHAPSFFVLWDAMFVCAGLYFVAGRFLFDAWLRRRTYYALTDQRILIERSRPFGNFTAVSLSGLNDSRLSEQASGRGTIRFGPPAQFWRRRGFSSWSPALDPTPQFLAIEEARRVFDLVQRATGART